ncbi:4-oxalocrotonate tautomerase [Ancylobacter sp. 6x-1]|uniref:4-oxalocrotonate tautomerase n=2 Tax=Ancylobacter crimeensis TaxID=2579147 RepID=A0ABT0DB48_9HYPH|nr:4-oxalocrotonate tautomerase [Ancylobacter crimeensis]
MPSIRVELLPGRTNDQKRAFAEAVTRESVRILNCVPEDVEIIYTEVSRDDWAVAGKLLSDPKGD